MADIDSYNRRTVSSIETFFDGLLRGKTKLTENLFFEQLPTSWKKEWNELVLIDCGNPQRERDAYGVQTILVYLYVKANAYGRKDVKTLQKLEKRLNELILGNDDLNYHTSLRGRYSNYSAVNDVFYDVIQINLVVT